LQKANELYTHLIRDRERQLHHDFDHRAGQHLDAQDSSWVKVSETYEPPFDSTAALLIGAQLRGHPCQLAGADLSDSASWKQVAIGDRVERAADSVTAFCPAKSLLEVPVVVSTWMHQGHRHVQVAVRTEYEEEAHAYLRALEESGRWSSNPWRLQLLEAKAASPGIRFESRPVAEFDPGPLWFPEQVSDVITRNVVDVVGL
jgi:hypothetical protein